MISQNLSEPFTKLAIDAIGPMQISSNINRYVITAICFAPKYPDAMRIELGIISQSNWSTPTILVENPGKNPRPCVDYRALKSKTRVEFFPLPHIEKVVEKVSSASCITVMDLTKDYFQIPMSKWEHHYAAFVTLFGSFLPTKMMIGLLNSLFYFYKIISQVLNELEELALPYIDDISIFSKNWKSHLKHEDIDLTRLTTSAAAPRYLGAKIAIHIQQ